MDYIFAHCDKFYTLPPAKDQAESEAWVFEIIGIDRRRFHSLHFDEILDIGDKYQQQKHQPADGVRAENHGRKTRINYRISPWNVSKYYPEVKSDVILNIIYESEYQDEEFDLSTPDKRFIGTVELILPPNSPKNLSLKCQLSLNTEGMLDVEASEPLGKKVKAAFNIRVL